MLDDLSLYSASKAKSGTLDLWLKALFSPTTQTFQQIIDHPDASIRKALYWLFISGGIGGLLAGLVQTAFNTNSFFGLVGFQASKEITFSAIFWSFLSAVILSIGLPIITLIYTGIIQLAVRVFGAKPNHRKLLFAFSAFQAPLGFLICILGGIPTIGCIALPMMVYWLVLGVQATRTVCELETGKAVICSISPFALGGVFGLCALVTLLAASTEIV